jgi:ABC-type glucose/galactose transport system permease subunit
VATCTAAPLLTLFVVTDALSVPAVRPAREVTVNCVVVAVVTVPVVPPENVTTLFPAVGEKPVPVIVIVVAVIGSAAAFNVTVGWTVTDALAVALSTCAEVLLTPAVAPAVNVVAAVPVA